LIKETLKIKKLQQFYILKFSSSRLKKAKYNININIDEGKNNHEIITINNSELLRTLFNYKNKKFTQNELDNLLKTQKALKKLNNTEENRKKLQEIIEKIEKILFVEDLVSIEFDNKSHYLAILKNNGFYINGTKFVPFLASAGMIRRNSALFINNNLKHPIMDILENGRNESVPMVAEKFGAYFSLYVSSSLPVSFPKFAIVPDKEIETIRTVDFVSYKGIDEDDDVVEKEMTLKLNAWDGQGLISPFLAMRWSEELELDNYIFSCAIVRAPFLKGLLVTFDFKEFAKKIAKKDSFIDIYGKEIQVENVDLLISESMFKLWSAYNSTESYINNCNKNNLGFSIAKVNPKKENNHSRTSYQFLQILKLKDTDIAKLCEPTINWFRNISGGNPNDMLLYAIGETGFEPKDFNKLDITTKALLLNPALSRDSYIQEKFINTLGKKEKESYMGSLLIHSNYQFMISDPYYQAAHIFGIKSHPLLKDKEHYSEYWLNRGAKTVAAIRSPIVHHSELNTLNFKNTAKTKKWYKHIHSGIIYPANGIGLDCPIHGGADFDGDLVCTTDNQIILKGKIPGLPVVYESQKATKSVVNSRDDESQVKMQLKGHNSKVGFATNISSSYYAILEEFPENSQEKETILKRLKIGRVIQGEIIDGVKGLTVPPFRQHWIKQKKINPEKMTSEEIKKWEFYNKIRCEKRPAFFRFLYPHYMSRYKKELKRYNTYAHLKFKKSFGDIYKGIIEIHQEEKDLIKDYIKNSYFIENKATVNRISNYMRTNLALVEKYSSKSLQNFDYRILKSGNSSEPNPALFAQIKEYIQEYKAFKRGIRHDLKNQYGNLDSFAARLRKNCFMFISSSESELVDYAIEATYGENDKNGVEFVWKLFPDGIFQNILLHRPSTIKFPVQDENGEIEYLWSRYSLKEIPLEEIYEE
jgi:hypothetical protein